MTKAEITEAVAEAIELAPYSSEHMAHAAILALLRAIREPSFAMRRAADERTGTGDPHADIYTAMIDTLLAEMEGRDAAE